MNQQTTPIRFPAEWEPQSGVQLTWPHEKTDWSDMLDEVIPCFVSIAKEIAKQERVCIVCPDKKMVIHQFEDACDFKNISFYEIPSNDTWARDHAPISVFENNIPTLLDFTFNGWGLQFAACYDNLITRKLVEKHAFQSNVSYQNKLDFVLEGGSIESDGEGTLLTTAHCLLSPNHNDGKTKEEIESYLKETFGLKNVLWLHHGYLAGDDTGSHIDTLSRFCTPDTIAYVKCDNPKDEHFEELQHMETELKEFKTMKGEAYNLIQLPMADPVYNNEERLPTTYANFLIINNVVLVPTYNSSKDAIAMKQLQTAFPDREIVGINCLPLIRQHGSLHCVTMQYPDKFL
jgi:agmatine/peptidylarginine deiminase